MSSYSFANSNKPESHGTETGKMDRLKIGDQAPYFCLTGTDGLIHSLTNYTGSNCLVIVFTSNHCPYAKMYEGLLDAIHHRYHSLGVRILAVCSNDGNAFPEDSFENMKLKDFPYPYLHDESQVMAEAFGAEATPEIFAFDKNMILQYHGPVVENSNDNEKIAKSENNTQSTLELAINSILSGSPVKDPEVPLIGCSIKWSR
ncbi:MAG TPA: thioredoxin family protein [Oligoflexia bacterium]|nr:thioredoxin family protein [Oligoflexia bacterium]HMP49570.1 thioredoxin family protein [Oligoflexia bacterium]